MNKIFLICPNCHIEQAIRKQYGENCFFLTALGTVFNMDEIEYAEGVNQLLLRHDITDMYIVNDSSSTFIQNVLTEGVKCNTDAEKTLLNLYRENKNTFEQISTTKEKALKLARLNIHRQANDLLDVAFLGKKIENGDIQLKGLIYDRAEKTFNEIPCQTLSEISYH